MKSAHEQISVVDNHDRVISVKYRSRLNHPTDIYRIAALWIEDGNDKFLLAKRSPGKVHDPSKWSVAVVGTVKHDETYRESIIKETQEELGIKINNVQEVNKEFVDTGSSRFFTQNFKAILPMETEFILDTAEVVEVTWFDFDSLLVRIKNDEEFKLTSAFIKTFHNFADINFYHKIINAHQYHLE